MILKSALNRACVRSISTCDELNLLNNKYITNKNIVTKLVANSAAWSRETYKISNNDTNIIGIDICNNLIINDCISESDLIHLYHDIIIKFRNKGYNIKLFSSGAESDHELINKILDFIIKVC